MAALTASTSFFTAAIADKPAWASMQKAAMTSDVSWQTSASQYASLYKTLLNRVAVP